MMRRTNVAPSSGETPAWEERRRGELRAIEVEVEELHARQAAFERGDEHEDNNSRAAMQEQAARIMVLRNQVMGRALERLQRRDHGECVEARKSDIGVVRRYELNLSLSAPDAIVGGALLGSTVSDWLRRQTRNAVSHWKSGGRSRRGGAVRMIRAAPSSIAYPVFARMRSDYAGRIRELEDKLKKAERERDAERSIRG